MSVIGSIPQPHFCNPGWEIRRFESGPGDWVEVPAVVGSVWHCEHCGTLYVAVWPPTVYKGQQRYLPIYRRMTRREVRKFKKAQTDREATLSAQAARAQCTEGWMQRVNRRGRLVSLRRLQRPVLRGTPVPEALLEV